MSQTAQAERAEQKLVESLRHEFFEIATLDTTLAIAAQAQCDMMQEGDFKAALKLNESIARRLQLLAALQPLTHKKI